jgi:hypothetical protein
LGYVGVKDEQSKSKRERKRLDKAGHIAQRS